MTGINLAALEKLASTRENRLKLCATSPLMFGYIYLAKHLTGTDGQVSIAPHHQDWIEYAKDWMLPGAQRDAFIAPRNSGKSTFWFLVLPMWGAAFGHVKFAAAFADSATQSEIHLTTFKTELDTNELLRADFPDLCKPAKRPSGGSVADNRGMMVMKNGFVFAARGIDASSLGLKVGELRPDLLIFDDIEPDESSYSPYQAAKRLKTVTEAVLPMNVDAKVVFVGTVTMPGGIMHQFVQKATGTEGATSDLDWIKDEKIKPHYYPPIIVADDGSEESCWPEKWPLKYLKEIQHTRSFAKNFKNLPIATDGDYWQEADFRYGEMEHITKGILSIDPAVTTKQKSDYTGMATVFLQPPYRGDRGVVIPPKVFVDECVAVKLQGPALRQKALTLIAAAPFPITEVIIEINQGGELWLGVFHDMPCKVSVITNHVKKEVRTANLLNHYQRDRIWHTKKLIGLEEQMMGYPNVLHDDMIDAVSAGVTRFARRKRHTGPQASAVSYV